MTTIGLDGEPIGSESPYDPPTNTLRPPTDSLLTIRVIKSFEYRTCKNLVVDHLDLTTMTVGALKEKCLQGTSENDFVCGKLP